MEKSSDYFSGIIGNHNFKIIHLRYKECFRNWKNSSFHIARSIDFSNIVCLPKSKKISS